MFERHHYLKESHLKLVQWHTVRALESGSVIQEMKNGPYEPQVEEDIMKVLEI